jgi:hypothetical protein
MAKDVSATFNDPTAIKFLATTDEDGTPNNALVGTLLAVDDETLAFADMMLCKTKKNLETTKKAAATVWKPAMTSFQVKGTFLGWQTNGPLIEMYNQPEMMRLNTTGRIDKIGLIKVEEVYLSSIPLPGRRLA